MSLIELPSNDDDREANESRFNRRIPLKALLAFFAGLGLTFSLAGTISIGSGEDFELGQRSFNVGTCVTAPIDVIPTVTLSEGSAFLSQFTVTGINPVTCDNRVFRILPFDTSEPNLPIPVLDTEDSGTTPDQTFIDVHINSGQFLASPSSLLSETSLATLSRSDGSTSVRISSWSSGASLIEVVSGGQGRTLKSTVDSLSGLSISFQIRLYPSVEISGYGRTDIELLNPAT
jgi:hypothetical protein